jgi:predicted NAD/FAD-dependent oxidoreductase
MFVFEEPLALGFDGAFLESDPLSWVARDASKPGRPRVESWVVHAGPEWTMANLELEREAAAEALLDEFGQRFGPLPSPTFRRAHRWRFALASQPVPGGALYADDLHIGACGDWCLGGRMEGAMMSGISLARMVLDQPF